MYTFFLICSPQLQLYPIQMHLVIQGLAVDLQQLGRDGLVAPRLLQGGFDLFLLVLGSQGPVVLIRGDDGLLVGRAEHRQVVQLDVLAFGEQHAAAHHIAQLAQVAVPALLLHPLQGIGHDAFHVLAQLLVGLTDEEGRQLIEVLQAVAQWRHLNGKLIDTMEQILTEPAFLDGLFQVLVGGR